MLDLVIDRESAVAPYDQLRRQITDAVGDGRLPVGAKLPTVRRLAEDLGVAANTVARSYRELEQDGIIETRGRNGSLIAAHGDQGQREAQTAAIEFAARIRRLRFPPDDAIALVRALLDDQP